MDTRIFFLLNTVQRRIFKYADNQSELQLGISITQAAAILFIGKQEGCLQKELAEALSLNKPAVTGLANRMEDNGLISRQPCQQDGRASRLYLSNAGKAKFPKIAPLIKSFNQMITADFSDAEIKVITRFLNTLMNEFG